MAPCLVSGLGLRCAQLRMSSSDLQWPGQFLHFFMCVVSGAGPQLPSLFSYLIHLCFVSSASSVICQLFIRNFTLFSCVQVSTFFCRLKSIIDRISGVHFMWQLRHRYDPPTCHLRVLRVVPRVTCHLFSTCMRRCWRRCQLMPPRRCRSRSGCGGCTRPPAEPRSSPATPRSRGTAASGHPSTRSVQMKL